MRCRRLPAACLPPARHAPGVCSPHPSRLPAWGACSPADCQRTAGGLAADPPRRAQEAAPDWHLGHGLAGAALEALGEARRPPKDASPQGARRLPNPRRLAASSPPPRPPPPGPSGFRCGQRASTRARDTGPHGTRPDLGRRRARDPRGGRRDSAAVTPAVTAAVMAWLPP